MHDKSPQPFGCGLFTQVDRADMESAPTNGQDCTTLRLSHQSPSHLTVYANLFYDKG